MLSSADHEWDSRDTDVDKLHTRQVHFLSLFDLGPAVWSRAKKATAIDSVIDDQRLFFGRRVLTPGMPSVYRAQKAAH